ncbi:MAG TPA: hypothetical protein VK465_01690 [Fibrobacteria bacterium]|nr:hypothetical protein [Fibrobacteria bacterium]
MYKTHHYFHIPVMGTGFTIDTPLRVAKFGISSVVSLVDDLLIERIRKHYAGRYSLPFEPVTASQPDARARRITLYLDMVHDIIEGQMAEIRQLPFEAGNDKSKYFEMLPDTSTVKAAYLAYLGMMDGPEKRQLEKDLNESILPGSIDCNIMTKLDRITYDREGHAMSMEHSDAKSALRGFAQSKINANMVFSAGINPTLYGYCESFPDFYRDDEGRVKKGIILKVSDYRSSMIQGKFLAKKGIEVKEFRIESGLNCGGHAFASDGYLMGPILQEFKDNRDKFSEMFEPMIQAYYAKKGRAYHASGLGRAIPVTAQGGIGNHAEVKRLMGPYGMDATGWASPFLLVPEASALDSTTRQALADAKEEDLYLSDVSPLGVVFNNLRTSSAHAWTRKQIEDGKPGSACPKKFLVSSTEFTDKPICTASKEYQAHKLAAMGLAKPPPADTPDSKVQEVYVKHCICDQLGNGALINLGVSPSHAPVEVCPGPNIAYFDRLYTLREMVNHIYGRGKSLVPESRPHMFVKDLVMSVDYFAKLVDKLQPSDRESAAGSNQAEGKATSGVQGEKALAYLLVFKNNLTDGLDYYTKLLATETPFPDENLASLKTAVDVQRQRLQDLWETARMKSGSEAAGNREKAIRAT